MYTKKGNSKSRVTFSIIHCFTVHNITDKWRLRSKVLSTLKLEGSHNSEAIKESLLKMKKIWRLPNIHAVTDSAANEVKAFQDLLKWPRNPCFGHNLHLSVMAGLKMPEVHRILVKYKAISNFFHRSPQATGTLKANQRALFQQDEKNKT